MESSICAGSCEKGISLLKETPKQNLSLAKSLFNLCGCLKNEKDYAKAMDCYEKVNESCEMILNKDESNIGAMKLQVEVIKGEIDLGAKIGPPAGGENCKCNKNGDSSFLIAEYDKALKQNPHNAAAWNDRGALLGEVCCSIESQESFEKAIQINPSLAEPWYNKGVLLYWDNPAEALKNFNRSTQLNPKLAEAWFNRYSLLLPDEIDMSNPSSKKAYEEAMHSYNTSINLLPDLENYDPPYHVFKRIGE